MFVIVLCHEENDSLEVVKSPGTLIRAGLCCVTFFFLVVVIKMTVDLFSFQTGHIRYIRPVLPEVSQPAVARESLPP